MPQQKDLKRVVRARMEKTGESYTAARLQVLNKKPKLVAVSKEPPPDYAKTAGMADAAIQKNTGRSWTEWVDVLDAWGAKEKPHRDIAAHVYSLGVPGWWSQSVTVGYERIRGLRERGQRRSGAFEANKSKTVNIPVDVLFDAWNEPRKRKRWLGDVKLKVRTATKPKSMRITWEDDTSVVVGFMAKGASKSAVAVQHEKLASKGEVERWKRFWTERLEALNKQLSK